MISAKALRLHLCDHVGCDSRIAQSTDITRTSIAALRFQDSLRELQALIPHPTHHLILLTQPSRADPVPAKAVP